MIPLLCDLTSVQQGTFTAFDQHSLVPKIQLMVVCLFAASRLPDPLVLSSV